MPLTLTAFFNLFKPEVGVVSDWAAKWNQNADKIDTTLKNNANAAASAQADATSGISKADAANTNANTRMPLAGGIFSGPVTYQFANPQFGLTNVYPGKAADGKRWGFLHFEDGNLYFQHSGMPADNPLRLQPDGQIVLAGNYVVKSEIQAAAAAAAAANTAAGTANTAAAAANTNANGRVSKTGGAESMEGPLTITGTQAKNGVRMVIAGKADWMVRMTDGNRLQFCDGGQTVEYASFGSDGTISTRQWGDANTYWEGRCAAHQNAAVNRCVSSARWVYAGDLGNNWNLGGGYTEPYGGAALTSRYTYTESDGTWNWGGGRWRYFQIYLPNAGGWITIGYT